MTSDDIKRAEEMLVYIPATTQTGLEIFDPKESVDRIAQALSEERARTLNSEAVQGLVNVAKEIDMEHDTITSGKYIGMERHDDKMCRWCNLQKALKQFQQFKDGKI